MTAQNLQSGTGNGSASNNKPKNIKEEIIIRFAGDSGDGMQLTGSQFTMTSAIFGNDIATFPDFPAEIRAPAGTVAGVSGFQVHISSRKIHTPGDQPDVLICMNPAALKANIKDLPDRSVLILNTDSFEEGDFKKAGYTGDPRTTGIHGDLKSRYQVLEIPITRLTTEALAEMNLPLKLVDRCKNFFALGVCYWLFQRKLEPTLKWIDEKFAKTPEVLQANKKALNAGFNFGDISEIMVSTYEVASAHLPPGTYRNITGNVALALGAVFASQKAGISLFLGSYPITPATEILQELAKYKNFGVQTFQAEDEIAGICSAIGAAYGGKLALTTTSGPGLALKQEALSLAIKTELPLVVIDVQRGGPSTGLPTKTEQADLYQAVLGRNGEAPVVVIAPNSPADCFISVYEAFKYALKYMTPVVLLSDGFIANGSEPWLIPDADKIPNLVHHQVTGARPTDKTFLPYDRDEHLARPWAIPGSPGYQHRIGGIEGEHLTGNISYDPDNHFRMVLLRQEKIDKVAEDYAPTQVMGDPGAKVCLLGWGSTYGSIYDARLRLEREGAKVAQIHLRNISPLPNDLKGLLEKFETVIVPEINLGQLKFWVQGKLGLTNLHSFPKVNGKPFKIAEIVERVRKSL